MIRNAIILKGLNLSIVTCWMKNLTSMMILHDIYKKFRLFKARQINQLKLKQKAAMIAIAFKFKVERLVYQKHAIMDVRRIC